MLRASLITRRFGSDTVLDRIQLTINRGERVGLVGPNGAGKSTLIRILAGLDAPDSGNVTAMPADLRIGYLPQALLDFENGTVGDVLLDGRGDWGQSEREIAQIEAQLAEPDQEVATIDALLERYAEVQERWEAAGGYERIDRANIIAAGLGVDQFEYATAVAQLSGGERTRLGLARLLLIEPDLLVLDEPTNHLDIDALDWLEAFLLHFPGAILVASHDRAFLDAIATRLLVLDAETHTLQSYEGGYSAYEAARQAERDRQAAAWQDQQTYVAQVESDIRRLKGDAQTIQNGPKRGRDYYGGVSAKVARIAKSRERKLERYLESDERVEKPRNQWGLRLDLIGQTGGSDVIVRAEYLWFGYPDHEPLLRDVSFDVLARDRIALIGPNGAGKSTLIKLLLGELQPNEGTLRLSPSTNVGYLAQESETLDGRATVLESLRNVVAMNETEARTFLHRFLFEGDAAHRLVGVLSYGERVRLQLARLVAAGSTFLVLDEPLNHLDIPARERFEDALASFNGAILLVSHDRYFVERFADTTWHLQDGVWNGS